jgi:hypothetical protein
LAGAFFGVATVAEGRATAGEDADGITVAEGSAGVTVTDELGAAGAGLSKEALAGGGGAVGVTLLAPPTAHAAIIAATAIAATMAAIIGAGLRLLATGVAVNSRAASQAVLAVARPPSTDERGGGTSTATPALSSTFAVRCTET